jgi:putative ABC transport system ATP-binding protein
MNGFRAERNRSGFHFGVTLVNAGDRLGVLGPSGAGKTVLLRAMALLDPMDAGTIFYQGEVVVGDEVPRYRSQVIYLNDDHQFVRALLVERPAARH